MKPASLVRGALPLSALLVLSAGCRTPINLVMQLVEFKEPMRMAVVTDNPLDPFIPVSQYDKLAEAMRGELGQPVQLDSAFPVVAGPALDTGHFSLAIATPYQFARLTTATPSTVLAAPANSAEEVARPALLVVKTDSDIASAADLKGKRVAFGPLLDSRSFHAALLLLRESGVAEVELRSDVPLLPNLWQNVPQKRRRLQFVLEDRIDAAFIDAQAWAALSEMDERADEPCRTKLRTVAATAAVPDVLIICSATVSAERSEEIKTFLLSAGETHPAALSAMDASGFYEVPEAAIAASRLLQRSPFAKSQGTSSSMTDDASSPDTADEADDAADQPADDGPATMQLVQ